MRTEDDIRSALHVKADEAELARVELCLGEKHRSRRPMLAVGLAAVRTAAVAVAVPLALAGNTTKTTPVARSPHAHPAAFATALHVPASGDSPALRFGFAVTPVTGYVVTPSSINRRSQKYTARTASTRDR
jgi:hypothetical protein